jgi:prevent-host-death family protein
MRAIGVRELRQRASDVLRDVEAGETVAVTSRGRRVALLIPIAEAVGRQGLIARGRLHPAATDALELGPPLAPKRETPLPSAVLTQARDAER